MSVFVVPEHAGVQSAARLRDGLLKALDEQQSLSLDLSGVIEADLSLLQLVEATRLEARRRGKSFALTAPATGAVRAALTRAGFPTDKAGEATAYWFHGEQS